MPALTRAMVIAASLVLATACSKKVTQTQCDAILDRYAELVVKETKLDASADEVKAEQARERAEAKSDDAFRNCTSEIEPADYDCAMKATSADALEKCLE